MFFKKYNIKNSRSLLVYVLLCPIVVDLVIGISAIYDVDFSIGKLYRGLLYAIGILVIIMRNRGSFLVFFSILWLLFFCFWIFNSSDFNFVREISFFFKATYLWAILEIIKGVRIPASIKTSHLHFILKRYAQIVAICILFSFITGVGLETYGKWVFGTKSFFVAQNDIGVSQLLIFTFLLFNKNLVRISWLWLVMISLSLILLGTTTGMFGTIAVIGTYVFIKLVLSRFLSVSNFFIRLFATLILVATIAVSSTILIKYIMSSDYYSLKYEKILKEGVRSRLTNAGDAYFETRGWMINVFGEGFSSYTTNLGNDAPGIKYSKKIYKDWLLVETDYYDFFGSFGIALSLVFFSYYFYCLILCIINYLNSKTIYNISLLIVFFMAMLHGYMAGHVFYSPTVLGILAAIVFLIQLEYYKGDVV